MAARVYVDFQTVKRKISIPEVLEVLGIAERFARKGDKLVGVCPLPSHIHGPRPNDQQFHIDRKDDIWLWKCFSSDCNKGGDVIELVKAMTGLSDAHVRFWFADHFPADRIGSTKTPERRQADTKKAHEHGGAETTLAGDKVDSVDIASSPAPLKPLRFHLNLDPAVPYLTQRGLTPETIERFGCGLAKKGVLAGYVAIPIYRWPAASQNENAVGYIGRWPGEDFDDEHPRYKAPSGFEVSRTVFGLPQAMASPADTPLVVTEGALKTMWLDQCGFASVSTLTATVSDEQADILVSTKRPLVLMFDGNAQAAMRLAAAKLITRSFVKVVKLPADSEPDDLSPEELRELLSPA